MPAVASSTQHFENRQRTFGTEDLRDTLRGRTCLDQQILESIFKTTNWSCCPTFFPHVLFENVDWLELKKRLFEFDVS